MDTVSNQNRILLILAGSTWLVYLATLCPTLFYQDAPEFINTAHTLGISHPAGFPTYNLLAKILTFVPLGSIAFRVNLFSALMAVVALVVVWATGQALLRFFYGDRQDPAHTLSVLVPLGYLAFCPPFWEQSLLAEVYTLHVGFTAGLILLLLQWRLKGDLRFLYGAGLLYGLSAGNHATVAFYLPAILLLFFCWCRERPWVHLSRCIALFLIGLSVYAYLPVRSLAEPSFDWGNPETVKGFFFQVTDRKDAHAHFDLGVSGVGAPGPEPSMADDLAQGFAETFRKTGYVLGALTDDLTGNLFPISFLGLLVGGLFCLRRSPPLFGFFAIVVGVNAWFFYTWRQESYLPTYLVASLLTAVVLYRLMRKPESGEEPVVPQGGLRWRPLVWTVLVLLIPYTLLIHFNRVDRSGDYSAETLPKRLFLTLDDHALFLPALSWFYYYYHQDVERLRDDVTAVSVWDLLNPDPPEMLTDRRYPALFLPSPANHDFSNKVNHTAYLVEFLDHNRNQRPILMELNETFFEQTGITGAFQPNKNVFLEYVPGGEQISGKQAWQALTTTLEEEMNRPHGGKHGAWINLPHFWMTSLALYARETQRYDLEANVYQVLSRFFGRNELKWQIRWLENRLNRGQENEAKMVLKEMETQAPEAYETWLARGLVAGHAGDTPRAASAFKRAAELNLQSFRPLVELAKVRQQAGQSKEAWAVLEQARPRIQNLLEFRSWQRAGQNSKP